jgi:hypothetical protein
MTNTKLTCEQLEAQLAELQAEYAAVIERGGYAPRLFVAIDNIQRKLAWMR